MLAKRVGFLKKWGMTPPRCNPDYTLPWRVPIAFFHLKRELLRTWSVSDEASYDKSPRGKSSA